jgi:plastocyanin
MQESALSGVRPVDVRVAKPRPQTWRYLGIAAHSLTLTAGSLFFISVLLSGTDMVGIAISVPIVTLTGASLATLVWTGPRGQWFAGFIGLLLALLIAPGLGNMTLESFFDFSPILFGFVGGVLAVVAAAAELTRRPEPGEGSRAILTLGGGIAVAAMVCISAVSGVVTLTGKTTLSESERAGSTAVLMKDFKFAPDPLTVTAGEEVKFAVKNSDPVIHDLKIKELDLKIIVNPGSEKLLIFTAPEAGEYTIVCTLHGGMDSKLVVTAP